MLKINLLGASWGYVAAKAENNQNQPSGVFLGAFGGQGVKMVKTSLLGASWGPLAAKSRKLQKSVDTDTTNTGPDNSYGP